MRGKVAATVITIAVLALGAWTVFSWHGASQAGDTNQGETEGQSAPDIDWDYWKRVNPDICAWVRIPGTGIDYPIVAADETDPDFYLDHSVDKSADEHGAIYLDADCTSGLDSPNVVILGHHMNDGSMFSEVADFHDGDFAEAHKTIEILAPDETRTLEVTSTWTIPGTLDAKKTDFVNEEAYVEYKRRCYNVSDVKLVAENVACDGKKRLYTFCTCSYYEYPENERTLVFARQAD